LNNYKIKKTKNTTLFEQLQNLENKKIQRLAHENKRGGLAHENKRGGLAHENKMGGLAQKNKRGGLAHKTSLTPSFFNEMSVPSQQSVRSCL
jgi:hypothetical protein